MAVSNALAGFLNSLQNTGRGERSPALENLRTLVAEAQIRSVNRAEFDQTLKDLRRDGILYKGDDIVAVYLALLKAEA